MITLTEQQYIVHLDIRANAVDASGALEEVLERVQLGGQRVAYSVEAVGSVGERYPVPTGRGNSSHAGGAAIYRDANAYHGEFLG